LGKLEEVTNILVFLWLSVQIKMREKNLL
jgi:hypothetical protein